MVQRLVWQSDLRTSMLAWKRNQDEFSSVCHFSGKCCSNSNSTVNTRSKAKLWAVSEMWKVVSCRCISLTAMASLAPITFLAPHSFSIPLRLTLSPTALISCASLNRNLNHFLFQFGYASDIRHIKKTTAQKQKQLNPNIITFHYKRLFMPHLQFGFMWIVSSCSHSSLFVIIQFRSHIIIPSYRKEFASALVFSVWIKIISITNFMLFA